VHQRVAMHAVRDALLDRQIAALGLPCIKVPLPTLHESEPSHPGNPLLKRALKLLAL
jgi:hypothetical protein